MNNKIRKITTLEELKIFSDPYRRDIISLYQSSSKPLTVKQIADIIGDNAGKVDYHIKKLLSIDILELDHIELINGIRAKYYKLIKSTFEVDLRDEKENDLEQVDHVTRLLIKSVNYRFWIKLYFWRNLSKLKRKNRKCNEQIKCFEKIPTI